MADFVRRAEVTQIRVRTTVLAAAAGLICMAGLVPASATARQNAALRPVIPDGMSALTYHRMLAQIPLDAAAAPYPPSRSPPEAAVGSRPASGTAAARPGTVVTVAAAWK